MTSIMVHIITTNLIDSPYHYDDYHSCVWYHSGCFQGYPISYDIIINVILYVA
jgi:hypothetical protein